MSDPFSQVLGLVEARSVVTRGLEGAGRWGLAFPVPGRLKLTAVARGRAWVQPEGLEGIQLEEGDLLLLDGRRGFVLGSDAACPADDAYALLEADNGAFVAVGTAGPPETVLLTGAVSVDPACGALLTDVLPEVVHVAGSSPHAAGLRWIVEQLLLERESTIPGAEAASAQLAQLWFVQILRAHVAGAGTLPPGWLRALGDARLAEVMRALHADPARAWTVAELARIAHMSRTSFAVRFKELTGIGPLGYLLRWRMSLAKRDLQDAGTTVASIAERLGYGSESAFSHAFKRVTGASPSAFRQAVSFADSERSSMETEPLGILRSAPSP